MFVFWSAWLIFCQSKQDSLKFGSNSPLSNMDIRRKFDEIFLFQHGVILLKIILGLQLMLSRLILIWPVLTFLFNVENRLRNNKKQKVCSGLLIQCIAIPVLLHAPILYAYYKWWERNGWHLLSYMNLYIFLFKYQYKSEFFMNGRALNN